ncbi:MAG: ABC transporter ATP-binding protein/permease [Alphaproteobacteria bacterium]|nr:ABC transporter ATP-binding protein/permease [Alphaproteobacteria bacterium]
MFKKLGKNKKFKRFEIVEEGDYQIDERYIKRNKDGDVKLIPFFWQFFRNGKFLFIFAFTLIQLSNLFSSAIIPFLIKEILNIIDASQKAQVFSNVSLYIYTFLAIFSLTWLIQFVADNYINRRFYSQKRKELRLSLFNYLQKHSYKYYTENPSGKLNSKINSVLRVFNIIENINWFYLYIIISVIFNGIVFFSINKYLGILMFTTMALMSLAYFFFKKPIKKISEKREKQGSKTSGVYIDCFTNFLNMKLFSSVKKENRFLKDSEDRYTTTTYNTWGIKSFFSLSVYLIREVIAVPLVILLSVYLYSKGQIKFGDLSYCIFMFSRIVNNFNILLRYISHDLDAVSEIRSALKTILQPIEIKDKEDAKKLSCKKGKIEFNNVYFSYNGKDSEVLRGFNLTIEAGQKVGIVGHSGSGKTTFMNLLLRFYEKQKGQILIDGQEIADVTQDSLRNAISVVPQDAVLFNRSLKENIVYAKPSAKKNELEKVAKDAHALKFIEGTEKGWNTIVGERGIKLSGGQKQRVAIARAMLKDAPIIFLDEATSALDSETEAHIQGSFNKLMENKTSIVVAHRLSTLKHLDRIIVLDKGKIVQDGTHAQLIRKKGIYKELWDKQVGGFVSE